MSAVHTTPSDTIRAYLFDLDGVLTDSASVHATAWKQTFDEFLTEQAAAAGREPVLFDLGSDYLSYVDGRRRDDGIRSFLSSRGIDPDPEVVTRIGDLKTARFLEAVDRGEATVYPDALALLDSLRERSVPIAVVSSSANAAKVLERGGLTSYLEALVDGVYAAEHGLAGKPAPDTYLEGAQLLGVEASAACVLEDATVGVAAGRAGSFGLVVGVDRVGQRQELFDHGADVVVESLEELISR